MPPPEIKYTSVTFIPPPPPPPPLNQYPDFEVTKCSNTGKSEDPPMPKWNCFDIPKPDPCKVSKCPPAVPKPSCSSVITRPTIQCPPIQRPTICPIEISIQHDLPAGSCTSCDTVERESNAVSLTVDGKTTVLCSEGYERTAKYVTRKDNKGVTHTYCKEMETKSNMAKSSGSSGYSCKPLVTTKFNSCGASGRNTEYEREG